VAVGALISIAGPHEEVNKMKQKVGIKIRLQMTVRTVIQLYAFQFSFVSIVQNPPAFFNQGKVFVTPP
jgi:hypothetical protein